MSNAEKPALDLDALQALADAATPGPWSGERDPGSSMYFVLRNVPGDYIHIATRGWTWADVNFIGHAREAIPALIARVREAERERDELRAMVLVEDAEPIDHSLSGNEPTHEWNNKREMLQSGDRVTFATYGVLTPPWYVENDTLSALAICPADIIYVERPTFHHHKPPTYHRIPADSKETHATVEEPTI